MEGWGMISGDTHRGALLEVPGDSALADIAGLAHELGQQVEVLAP